MTFQQRPWLPWWLPPVLALLAGLITLIVLHERHQTAPDLRGRTLANAATLLKKHHLRIGSTTYAPAPDGVLPVLDPRPGARRGRRGRAHGRRHRPRRAAQDRARPGGQRAHPRQGDGRAHRRALRQRRATGQRGRRLDRDPPGPRPGQHARRRHAGHARGREPHAGPDADAHRHGDRDHHSDRHGRRRSRPPPPDSPAKSARGDLHRREGRRHHRQGGGDPVAAGRPAVRRRDQRPALPVGEIGGQGREPDLRRVPARDADEDRRRLRGGAGPRRRAPARVDRRRRQDGRPDRRRRLLPPRLFACAAVCWP